MKNKKIRVVIADDHTLIREGIKQILELENDIEVVGQANDGEEAFSISKDLEPDVVLLDINMPKLNGIETLIKFKDMGLKSKIIILTIHEDKEYILKTLKLGSDGYILKDSNVGILINGIREVAKGKRYIQPSVEELVNRPIVEEFDNTINKIQSLTKREYEILILIAEGLNNKEIADGIYISEKTVKNHVSSIFRKLNLNDRVQAAIFAYKNNIKKL